MLLTGRVTSTPTRCYLVRGSSPGAGSDRCARADPRLRLLRGEPLAGHTDGMAVLTSAKMGLLPGARDSDRLQQLRAVLPCQVRVTSRTHPLSGRLVAARSFKRLNGELLLLVIELPDGSPGTIPADATDVLGPAEAGGPPVVLDAGGWRRLAGAGGVAGRAGRGGPVMAGRAETAACGGCGLSRARGYLERAVGYLEEADLAWGCWADEIRQLAEQHYRVADFDDRPGARRSRIRASAGHRRCSRRGGARCGDGAEGCCRRRRRGLPVCGG